MLIVVIALAKRTDTDLRANEVGLINLNMSDLITLKSKTAKFEQLDKITSSRCSLRIVKIGDSIVKIPK